MTPNRYVLIHFIIELILIIKYVSVVWLLISNYDDYNYTYKLMIIICALICDSITILLTTIEIIWSLLSKRIVTCMSNPPFCGDISDHESRCGFFRPYYLQITGSYLIQTFVIALFLALRESPIIPGEIMALSVCTFVLFSIIVVITVVSCLVTIEQT